MRELILGGEGLIGSTLAPMLAERGHEVASLDLKSGCDLRRADLDAPFAAADRVWFLAWDTGGAKYIEAADSQHEQYRNNTEITLRVMDALARTRKPFVFTSTQLTVVPNAYGVTKLLAENWARQLGGKVARLWNTYGWEEPDVKSHVVTDLVLAGLARGRVECMTDGAERRRFIYKTDTAEAIARLVDSDQPLAHIAGAEWVSIRQLAEEIARQLGAEVKLGAAKGTEHIIDPEYPLPDWRPKVSLAEGVARVIADARSHLAARGASQGA
ncbi:MAG: NAD(P)-dependent oxidoreductase [Acidobacteria bacterium]|nr:NAD(P)-dependent oxidoreductase [Acidobacteriota bacterium]MCA1632213.1 NAD(P)-dependent oxidoreductase [Acidobacteriota bacterium]MCA1640393.1 NAD(P)-dependent oxidoreductase [Acidobacteriota bacterium]